MMANWRHWKMFAVAFAVLILSPPVDAATFNCGKVFVTFTGKKDGHPTTLTVRRAAVARIDGVGKESALILRLPGGSTFEAIVISEDTHTRLIACLN